MNGKKLKRAVIKEELVELTGDFVKAVILGQFLYWSERVRDVDRYIEEERRRFNTEGEEYHAKPTHGWIYKSSEELAEETMLGKSPSSMREHIKYLVHSGWLDERTNPDHSWDRTKQYRVNVAKIQQDLAELGYPLDGYAFSVSENAFLKTENGFSEIENRSSETENRFSKTEKQYQRLLTDTTSEITYTHTQHLASDEIFTAMKETTASLEDPNESVCDVQHILEQKGIRVQMNTVQKWMTMAPTEDVIYAAQLALQDGVRNPAGFIGGILQKGIVRVEKKPERDPRYEAFYRVMGE